MTISQRITALPPAPDPAIHPRTEFAQIAAASVLAQRGLPAELNNFATQANALAVDLTAKSGAATTAAQTATAAAQTATATVNAAAWVSGTNYPLNSCAISQVNFQTYRRRVAGAGTVDPANDSTNWMMLASPVAFIPQVNASTSFDLSTTNYFKRTVNGSETWAFNNCPQDGYSWTVEVTHVAGAITLPASVKTPGNLVYTLTPGKTHLLMFVTSNKGARIRLVAANNFDN